MSDDVLDASETRMIDDETAILRHVQSELARVLAKPVGRADFDLELTSLRDQIAESRAEDHAMLVEHMTRLSALRAAQDREYAPPVDPSSPYFGRLHLIDQQNGQRRERDVLIGRRAFIDTKRGVQIVDWRNSPISRIYYCYAADDDYEERFANEIQVGKVALRRSLNISEGELVRVREGEQILVKNHAGEWQRLSEDRSRLAGGMGSAMRAPSERLGRDGPDLRLPEITALIDPVQFRIITDERSGVVIIRGGAGTGKTTIALHRVAYLAFQDSRRFSPKRTLVITPGDALRRYVMRVLPALDVRGVPIKSFPQWAHQTVKRLIPDLRKRKLTDDTPMGARRLKRAPALLKMLEKMVVEEARGFDAVLEGVGGRPLLDAWVRRRNVAPIQRLNAVERWMERGGADELGPRANAARKALIRVRREISDPVETWANLLTDRARLAKGFANAGVEYKEWELDQLVDVVAQQADEPEDYKDVDGGRAQGIDGRDVADNPIRGRLDIDDLAILLRACQLKYGRLKGPSGQTEQFEHVVVDEAQDLSPMILKVLTMLVPPGGPVTLAGDTAQRLHLDTGFADWETLVSTIGVKAHLLPPLAISYRSTRQVMTLARHVLGPLAPDVVARDARDGAPVEMLRFDEQGEAVAFLADALKSLRNRERRATVALVARSPAIAELYYRSLARAEVPELRRVRNEDFEFTPGIDVTDVYQIKGLEYDYVIVLEPTLQQYPDTLESRHLLHVAATRAAHQLWLVTSTTPSPLLPDALIRGETLDAE